MEEASPLLRLPRDVLVENILIPQFKAKEPEKTFLSIQNVNKFMKYLCNTPQIQSCLNLTNHLVFDSTRDIRYVRFILHCADNGNIHASLIYGLSMGFCFGQHDEATKYLAKIKDECCVAEYAYGILLIEHPKTRVQGMTVLNTLHTSETDDHLPLCRIRLLQMLNPGIHFNKNFKELDYICRRGPNCHWRKHNILLVLDGKSMVLRCSDRNAASIEYNVLQKAIVSQHFPNLRA